MGPVAAGSPVHSPFGPGAEGKDKTALITCLDARTFSGRIPAPAAAAAALPPPALGWGGLHAGVRWLLAPVGLAGWPVGAGDRFGRCGQGAAGGGPGFGRVHVAKNRPVRPGHPAGWPGPAGEPGPAPPAVCPLAATRIRGPGKTLRRRSHLPAHRRRRPGWRGDLQNDPGHHPLSAPAGGGVRLHGVARLAPVPGHPGVGAVGGRAGEPVRGPGDGRGRTQPEAGERTGVPAGRSDRRPAPGARLRGRTLATSSL